MHERVQLADHSSDAHASIASGDRPIWILPLRCQRQCRRVGGSPSMLATVLTPVKPKTSARLLFATGTRSNRYNKPERGCSARSRYRESVRPGRPAVGDYTSDCRTHSGGPQKTGNHADRRTRQPGGRMTVRKTCILPRRELPKHPPGECQRVPWISSSTPRPFSRLNWVICSWWNVIPAQKLPPLGVKGCGKPRGGTSGIVVIHIGAAGVSCPVGGSIRRSFDDHSTIIRRVLGERGPSWQASGMSRPPYLSSPSFGEENAGPAVAGRWGEKRGVDPTLAQVRARCQAVQATWSKREERLRRFPHIEGDNAAKAEIESGWCPPTVTPGLL